EPSDVAVLVLMSASPAPGAEQPNRITRAQHMAISHAEVAAYPATFDSTLRPIHRIIAERSFAGWDRSFVEAIARDGLLLGARERVPAPLAAVTQRSRSARAHVDPPG